MNPLPYYRLLLGGWLLALASSPSALAQTHGVGGAAPAQTVPAAPALKTHQGEYEGGRATYTYYLGQDGRRVRHGSFVSTRTEAGRPIFLRIAGQRITSNDYTEYRAARTYARGQPTGSPWAAGRRPPPTTPAPVARTCRCPPKSAAAKPPPPPTSAAA